MNYLPTTKGIIYTAKKDEVLTLNIWNETEGYPQLFVSAADKVLNGRNYEGYDVMDIGGDHDAHTVHVVELKKGESITAWSNTENAISFEIEK